jgi:hypothetical protein
MLSLILKVLYFISMQQLSIVQTVVALIKTSFSTGKTFSVETLHTGKYNFLFFTIHLTLTGNDNLTPCPCTLSLKYQWEQ